MKQLFASAYSGALCQFAGEVKEFMLPVRDNVRLFTRIYRKTPLQQGPVILVRNPYQPPSHTVPEIVEGDTADWVGAGYILVEQHCRGTGRSEGICIPYLHERHDGLDLLEWIRQQSFYQGEIFLSGGSYLSSVHFAWLDAAGDDIKGAVLAVQDCKRYNILYRNGFFKCGLHGGWAVGMYRRNQNILRNYTEDTFRSMPLTDFSKIVFSEESTFIQEEFKHPWPEDPFWETPAGGGDYARALDHLNFPVLFITGFYDIYTEGILAMWDALSPAARAKCALVITPYDHAYLGGKNADPFPQGGLREVWPHFFLDWFEAIRGKRAPAFVSLGQTTYYAQYEQQWITAPRLEDGPETLNFYPGGEALHSQRHPAEAWTYLYNPWNPASFKGGCCHNFGGQQIQDKPNSRYDIRSFLTEPFQQPVRLRGTGELRLLVASDCEDTCFYARLSHVRQDGTCLGLRDDIVSLKRLHPDYRPRQKAEVILRFTANAILLAEGEQLRLDLSSSCWPYFLPHRNTTENYWECTAPKIAHNTVFLAESELTLFCAPCAGPCPT